MSIPSSGDEAGKSSFVWNLSGLRAPGSFDKDVEKGIEYPKSEDSIVVGGFFCYRTEERSSNGIDKSEHLVDPSPVLSSSTHSVETTERTPPYGDLNSSGHDKERNDGNKAGKRVSLSMGENGDLTGKGTTTSPSQRPFVCIAAVPYQFAADWLAHNRDACDLVVLMYQCGDEGSLRQAMELEKRLGPDVPRLFVASKSDLVKDALDSTVTGSDSAVVDVDTALEHFNHIVDSGGATGREAIGIRMQLRNFKVKTISFLRKDRGRCHVVVF